MLWEKDSPMKEAWQQFKAGWDSARWSFAVLLALLPIILMATLLVQITQGQVPPRIVSSIVIFGSGILAGMFGGFLVRRYWRWTRRGWRSWLSYIRQIDSSQHVPAGTKGGTVGNRSRKSHRTPPW
jgi:hypothetical protein